MNRCLPISTASIELGRIGVEVDQVAGLLGGRGAGVDVTQAKTSVGRSISSLVVHSIG
jgi:hypothetical protein